MAKKDLQKAAARGADLFFTQHTEPISNTELISNTQDTQLTQLISNTQPAPHKAQDEQPEQLEQTIAEMADAIETREAAKKAHKKEAAEKVRVNIALSAAGYEYVKTMGAITGKGMSRFIADMIDTAAAANADTMAKARELISNAR